MVIGTKKIVSSQNAISKTCSSIPNMTLDGYLITEEMILWLSLKQEENFAWEWHQTRNH